MMGATASAAGDSFDWLGLDPGASDILLVGPTLGESARLAHADLGKLPQVAVDGGIAAAATPLLWAGDGDSGARPQHIPAAFKTDQNQTDLRFCLEGISGWRWTSLHLAGFFGERRDHELANYGELHQLLLRRPVTRQAIVYDGTLRVAARFLQAGQHRLDLAGRFSVLALEPAQLTLSGDCKYPAENLRLQPLSGHGISNEGHGAVALACDRPVMVLV